MYVFYGYRTDGIVQSLAEGLSAGLSGDDAQPGEFKYVDIYDGDIENIPEEYRISSPAVPARSAVPRQAEQPER